MSMMNSKFKLIVGLGNPSSKYLKNRHNAGFLILDSYVEHSGFGQFEKTPKFYGEILKKDSLVFLKPQTFMNNSGKSVVEVMNFFKISPEEVLVIHDELDLPFGEVKLVFDRGGAGHNGVLDIITRLGTQGFYRLRFGVGRPKDLTPIETFVLSDFTESELGLLSKFKLGDYLN